MFFGLFLEMITCCPFLHKYRRRGSRISRNRSEAHEAPSKEPSAADPLTENRPASRQIPNTQSSVKSASPPSSDCEFFDCKSDISNSVFWTGVDISSCDNAPCQEPLPPPVTSSWHLPSIWGLLGWTGSGKNHTKTIHRVSLERHDHGTDEAEFQESGSFAHGEGGRSASDTTIDPNQSRVLSALSNLIHHPKEPPSSSQSNGQERLVHGSSFERCEATCDFDATRERWEPADATKYRIRSKDYLKTRTKEPCKGAFYDVIGSDLISFPKKQTHVAQMIQLPDDPYKRTPEETAAIAAYGLPTLIVVNMQLPVYQVYLTHDLTLLQVAYEHFDPRSFPNQAALDLFGRFVEDCWNQSQYRIKLIPKFLNVDEWAQKGPLSSTEHRLVHQFNEKPILTRPYQHFFRGPNYFEVDVDVHSWLYVARKALWSLLPRMHEVVTEVALLIQGNRAEDLPEHIVAVARVYRVELSRFRYFSEILSRQQQETQKTEEPNDDRERLSNGIEQDQSP